MDKHSWFKKVILPVAAFFMATMASTVSATLISHNGYTLDTDTNIVSDGTLEWLRWDQTIGRSVNQAVAEFGGDGWGVASNVQMAQLFNAFFVTSNGIPWDADENTHQETSYSYSDGQVESSLFMELFGITGIKDICLSCNGDSRNETYALFGHDLDADLLHSRAYVFDSYKVGSTTRPQWIGLPLDFVTNANPAVGVALVRNANLDASANIPEPASIALVALGLAGMSLLRRKQHFS